MLQREKIHRFFYWETWASRSWMFVHACILPSAGNSFRATCKWEEYITTYRQASFIFLFYPLLSCWLYGCVCFNFCLLFFSIWKILETNASQYIVTGVAWLQYLLLFQIGCTEKFVINTTPWSKCIQNEYIALIYQTVCRNHCQRISELPTFWAIIK